MHQHDIGHRDSRSSDSRFAATSICIGFDVVHDEVMLLQNRNGKQILLKLNASLRPNPCLKRMLHFSHFSHEISGFDQFLRRVAAGDDDVN